MTTTPETNAAKADRYTKAALAALEAANLDGLSEINRDTLRQNAEAALRAASNYSKLALAEAIERSFPALDFETTALTTGGVELLDDEVGARIREHVMAHADSVGRHCAEGVTTA